MNKALTDGVVFMPPPFADGLNVWSSEDGTPGSNTYDGAFNAALVPADQDFDSCLEIFKNDDNVKLTYMGQTPFEQGCYLRISAKVKAVSGPLPNVRAVAWAAKSGGSHATGYVEQGPSVPLTAYGEVVEVSAIIGSGSRNGVDMIWGADVAYAHLGLEMTGSNGGIVRIDEIVIQDITGAYLRDMMDWVDVRDFGAAGDGVTNDRDAFLARFGMLFQGAALFDSLPVWQNVAFRLLRGSLKRPKNEAREIAIEKLRRVGLKPDVADKFPAELSGGMQKRVGLARAIAADPEIIFFDEPTTGLDPIMSGVINDLIREIVTEMGATAMTITHDMTSVRAIADNIAMLHEGVVQWTGPVAQMDASGNPYLDQFIHGRAEGPIEAVR